MSDITWDVFVQYAGLGVVTGVSLGVVPLFWSYFLRKCQNAFASALRVGDL